MFILLLQQTAAVKKLDFNYNDQDYTLHYIHDIATTVPSLVLYDRFTGANPTSPICLVAHASLLRDVSVQIEYSTQQAFALFGVGDFTLRNSSIMYTLSQPSQDFTLVVFGRSILQLENGTLSVKATTDTTIKMVKGSENLLFVAKDFILNFTVSNYMYQLFFDGVTYVHATNLSFIGTQPDETLLYHAGKPVFSCTETLMNCSVCEDHFYLKNGKCQSVVQAGMNCDGCIRGYVKGIKTDAIDDTLGCFEHVQSKKGENCYFGLESADPTSTKFKLRCARCYNELMDPANGCETAK